MASLQDVRDRARALLGDPDGDWATDGYLDPFVATVYACQIAYLANTCSTLQEKLVFVPGGVGANQLPQGATDLTALQKKGGLLDGLQDPIFVEWKIAGQAPECFVEMPRTRRLPNVSPVQLPSGTWFGGMQYEWRAEKIYITPNSQLIDMQVRGKFRAGRLLGKDDELLDDRMLETVAFDAAALTGVERGNQGYVVAYGSAAMNTLDDIAAALIRSEQGVQTRLGRRGGRRCR